MSILGKIINLALSIQEVFLNKKYNNMKQSIHITPSCTLELSAEKKEKIKKLEQELKQIVKSCENNPEKLLSYMKEQGTTVIKLKHADKHLALINETEGLITNISGAKAFYINLITGQGISNRIDEIFILRDMPIDKYYMIHQFYKWYANKHKLPGFDETTQNNFRKITQSQDNSVIESFNINEILGLKEAIARDIEAIDFVVKLAKESDGSKNALKKLKTAGGASI